MRRPWHQPAFAFLPAGRLAAAEGQPARAGFALPGVRIAVFHHRRALALAGRSGGAGSRSDQPASGSGPRRADRARLSILGRRRRNGTAACGRRRHFAIGAAQVGRLARGKRPSRISQPISGRPGTGLWHAAGGVLRQYRFASRGPARSTARPIFLLSRRPRRGRCNN